jgi:ornithine--oxo-acid transaminase
LVISETQLRKAVNIIGEALKELPDMKQHEDVHVGIEN